MREGNGTDEHFILAQTAFGKESCVKIERNGRGTWLQVGRKSDEGWDWHKAKLSDVEIAELLCVLDRGQEQASWFHTFNGNETRISAGRKEKTVFIRVDDYAAALNPGQQIVFAVLCQRILEMGCEQEPSRQAPHEQVLPATLRADLVLQPEDALRLRERRVFLGPGDAPAEGRIVHGRKELFELLWRQPRSLPSREVVGPRGHHAN